MKYRVTLGSRARQGLVAVVVLASILVAAQPAKAFAANQESVLQDYANQLVAVGTTSVLAEMQAGGSSVRVRAGEAVRGTGLPVAWQSHYRTGSTTKTFVSTVLLQLEAEGKLSLDDSVEHWLPGVVQGNGYDGNEITIRQLLNHTSGVFSYTDDDAFAATLTTKQGFYANRFNVYTPDQLIHTALSHPPLFAPGTGWQYSNTDYILAGKIISAVTGKSWRTEVQNRILSPLHLTETSSAGDSNPLMPAPYAHAYNIWGMAPNRDYGDVTTDNMSWAGSAGDLITTTSDENRFFQALMKGQLLPAMQLAEMKTIVPLAPGVGYGLGLVHYTLPCDSRGFWSHDGGTVGYTTTTGVTDDGARSVMISTPTTSFSDDQYNTDSVNLETEMVNAALCPGQTQPLKASPANVFLRATLRGL
jgi:D-alanyl-D-alanine carboxypeptidase